MARVTVKGLQAQLNVLNTLCNEQRNQIRELESKLATRGVIATPTPRASRELPAHFVAAREAAMRLGRVVRVSC